MNMLTYSRNIYSFLEKLSFTHIPNINIKWSIYQEPSFSKFQIPGLWWALPEYFLHINALLYTFPKIFFSNYFSPSSMENTLSQIQ